MPDLTPLIPVVAAILGYLYRTFIKTRLNPARIDHAIRYARVAVAAAEELGRTLDLDSAGKYEYAADKLTAFSKRVGLKLTPTEANALIHAVLDSQRQTVMDEVAALLSQAPTLEAVNE